MWNRYGMNKYSINEKIEYHKGRVNSTNKAISKHSKNKLDYYNNLFDNNNIFGKVFVVKDKLSDRTAGADKSRRVVAVDFNKIDKSIKVVPVSRNNQNVFLSGFDGNRFLNFARTKDIPLSCLYSSNDFEGSNKDYLTSNELYELRNKYEYYKSKNKSHF